MPKEQALKQFTNNGFVVQLPGSESDEVPDEKVLMVATKSKFEKRDIPDARLSIFSIAFASGRLSFAQRSWYDESDPLRSVVEAFGAVTKQGTFVPCSVSFSPLSDPSGSATRVFVYCGKRSLFILRGDYVFEGSRHAHYAVDERIGSPPES